MLQCNLPRDSDIDINESSLKGLRPLMNRPLLISSPMFSRTVLKGTFHFLSLSLAFLFHPIQGWAINSYQGQPESPELCERAANFFLLGV